MRYWRRERPTYLHGEIKGQELPLSQDAAGLLDDVVRKCKKGRKLYTGLAMTRTRTKSPLMKQVRSREKDTLRLTMVRITTKSPISYFRIHVVRNCEQGRAVRTRTTSPNSHFRNTRLVSISMCSGSAKQGECYLMLDMMRTRTKIQNSYFGNITSWPSWPHVLEVRRTDKSTWCWTW